MSNWEDIHVPYTALTRTVNEPDPDKKPVLYLPDGTPLVREKPPLGFQK